MSRQATWTMAGAVGLITVLAFSAPSRAALSLVEIYRNVTYQQTGPSTVVGTGGFFSAQATIDNAGEFNTASLTYLGPGSPQNLPSITPKFFGIAPSFATTGLMDAAFPFETYNFTVTNTTTTATQSAAIAYTADATTADVPALTAASYNELQGLNTSSGPLTVNFNAFTPAGIATEAFTFFSIGGTSQSCSFLPSSTTSCTIDPSALLPGQTYTWELDFSDRIGGSNNDVFTVTGFDVRTDGTFTTAAAVPEPGTFALLGSGLLGLALSRRRKVAAGMTGCTTG